MDDKHKEPINWDEVPIQSHYGKQHCHGHDKVTGKRCQEWSVDYYCQKHQEQKYVICQYTFKRGNLKGKECSKINCKIHKSN